jgi:hypothetical protein
MSLDQIQSLDPARAATPSEVALPAATRASAIFMHAGWRSCGTWLWETLRDSPTVRAYYEPLHEGLGSLDRPAIGDFRPDSWGSGHGGGAPYFAEFAAHLSTRGRGVEGYQQRFAFDDFFTPPGRDDPALRAYLSRLVLSAHGEGRLPVLKFCRSLGRVAWMRAQFPDALHVVMLRDPVAQWRSARLQMERDANHYFVLAPFLILGRNAAHPLLVDALRRLDVSLPPRLSGEPGVILTTTWRHVQKLSWAERYRAFLALWAVTAVTALASGADVVDADLLTSDAAHRRDVAGLLGEAAGVHLDLPVAQGHGPLAWLGSADEAEDAARAALTALGFVVEHRALLAPERARMLTRKLRPRFQPPAGDTLPMLTRAALPPPAPARRPPAAVRYVDAAAYLVLARASYPLRRAHFHVRRWLDR